MSKLKKHPYYSFHITTIPTDTKKKQQTLFTLYNELLNPLKEQKRNYDLAEKYITTFADHFIPHHLLPNYENYVYKFTETKIGIASHALAIEGFVKSSGNDMQRKIAEHIRQLMLDFSNFRFTDEKIKVDGEQRNAYVTNMNPQFIKSITPTTSAVTQFFSITDFGEHIKTKLFHLNDDLPANTENAKHLPDPLKSEKCIKTNSKFFMYLVYAEKPRFSPCIYHDAAVSMYLQTLCVNSIDQEELTRRLEELRIQIMFSRNEIEHAENVIKRELTKYKEIEKQHQQILFESTKRDVSKYTAKIKVQEELLNAAIPMEQQLETQLNKCTSCCMLRPSLQYTYGAFFCGSTMDEKDICESPLYVTTYSIKETLCNTFHTLRSYFQPHKEFSVKIAILYKCINYLLNARSSCKTRFIHGSYSLDNILVQDESCVPFKVINFTKTIVDNLEPLPYTISNKDNRLSVNEEICEFFTTFIIYNKNRIGYYTALSEWYDVFCLFDSISSTDGGKFLSQLEQSFINNRDKIQDIEFLVQLLRLGNLTSTKNIPFLQQKCEAYQDDTLSFLVTRKLIWLSKQIEQLVYRR